MKNTTVLELFVCFAVFEIILPLPFVDSIIVVLHDTNAMSFFIEKLSVVDSSFIFFNFEVLGIVKFLYIES